ncbi:MAG: sigma-70 family RNA polymerase sigma factor [Acidimicrobiia bacterium]
MTKSNIGADSWTPLLLAAQRGDRLALTELVRAAQPSVWRLAAHLVDRTEADDLTQEAFVRAYQALPNYRAESSARTWLLAIVRRTCIDALRSRARRRKRDARIQDTISETSSPDSAQPTALRELIANLEPDRREAFVLTQWIGCSYQEAAEICGVPIGTIRSRVARARSDLVTAWEETGS